MKTLHLLNEPINLVCKFPYSYKIEIDWPVRIAHKDKWYYWYGKIGTRIDNNFPSACYESEDYSRIWLDCDGTITED